MSIKVSCNSCGASFAARDDLAGKRVACPKCKTPIVVAAAADTGMGDLLDEIGMGSATSGGKKCPGCGSQMPAAAIVCTNCSYNVQMGRRMNEGRENEESAETKQLLRKAEDELKKSPEQTSDSDYGEGAGASWLLTAIMLICASAVLGLVIFLGTLVGGDEEEGEGEGTDQQSSGQSSE